MTRIVWDEHDTETERQVEERGHDLVLSAAAAVESLNGRHVTLRSLTPGISGANVFNATPALNGVPEVEGVLKVGPAELLVAEVNNYRTWVVRFLEDTSSFAMAEYRPDLERVAANSPSELVAVYYRRVGRMTFGKYIADRLRGNEVGEACDAVDRLLSILRPWQEKMGADASKALTAPNVYSFNPGRTFDAFEEVCRRLRPSDPLDWAHHVRGFWSSPGLHACRMLKTVLHGDLHTENVMVGDDGRLTLIDFGSCGEGHFLRDVCTLETHLLTRALVPDSDEEMDGYLEEFHALFDPEFLADPFAFSASTPISAVVSRLRRYAFACLMNGNPDYAVQYAFAVLRHAVRIATRDDSSTSDRQRLAAVHVARAISKALAIVDGRLSFQTGSTQRRAGLSFLRGPDHSWHHRVRAPIATVCSDDVWPTLADELLSGQRVDIFGLAPIALLKEMLTRAPKVAEERRAMYLNYVTTEPGGRGDSGLAYAHPRWRGSLTGMRNVIEVLSEHTNSGQGLTLRQTISQTNLVSDNCLIRVEHSSGADPTLYEIARLSEADRYSRVRFVVNVVDDVDAVIANWMDRTRQTADPIIMREAVCEPLAGAEDQQAGDDGDFPSLVMGSLVPYGPKVPVRSGLRPIALTILRSRQPGGSQILMKKRNALTDYDSFDKFSFLSTRILAEDIARAGNASHLPKEDADDDYTQLWARLGEHEPWRLDRDVFLLAAQRDVYACTLLDLPKNRFVSEGMQRIDNHKSGIQTCFVVFLVDLNPDEIEAAKASSAAMLEGVVQTMISVAVPKIFDGSVAVNEFTQRRGEWLKIVCARPPRQRA